MQRDAPLTTDETYHIYNRGAHKSAIFKSSRDYVRFQLLLFLCNGKKPIVVRDVLAKYKDRYSVKIFEHEPIEKTRLVSVLAYCLMPNHFHLVLRQEIDNGITTFMRKVGVAYSMHFNTKYDHSGVLFQGRYKSSHIDDESYFRYIFAYVHLNPIELIEPEWKERGIHHPRKVQDFLNTYSYASFYDYSVQKRPESNILARDAAPDFLSTQNDLTELLEERVRYVEKEGGGAEGNTEIGSL